MKGIGIIVLLISMIIVGVLFTKQREATVKMEDKEVKVHELPVEVKKELDQVNIQTEKRIEEGEEP